MTLNVGSLFSGIGGLDLGLERAGMTVVWQAEIDPYCCRVLAKHWPDVPNLGDVTRIDWAEVPHVDVICGGYPCQPFSFAGRRLGEADPRHLWPHMLDAIRVLRPRYALLENVPGHLALGFGRVLGDLAEIGYDCEWDCIPAAAVGAPHLRDRVFVVAYPDSDRQPGVAFDAIPRPRVVVSHVAYPDRGRHGGTEDGRGMGRVDRGHAGEARQRERARPLIVDRGPTVADTDGPSRSQAGPAGQAVFRPGTIERLGRCGGGERDHWAVEPDVGRVAHGVPHRVDRLRALGNAVVPQVAEHIGRRILAVAP